MKNIAARKNEKVTYMHRSKWKAVSSGHRVMFSLAVILAVYFSMLFMTQYWRLVQLRQNLSKIEQEIAAVHEQNEEMQREIERLHSPVFLEQIARQELGMVRSGELLFLFREADNLSDTDR